MPNYTGADAIADICDAVDAIIDAIPPPSGFTKAPVVWDDLSATPTVFPCVLTIPRNKVPTARIGGVRSSRIEIDVILVFAANEFKYASREQRAWIPSVENAIDQAIKLKGTVQTAHISQVNFDPVLLDQIPYVGITFTITAEVSEAYLFSTGPIGP